jgi:transcriptional regulator with XRE-family HTH domain
MGQIANCLKRAQDEYNIRGTDLAAAAGISQNHLSEIRNGRTWVSEEIFCQLLDGMDKLAPGSRQYFCLLLSNRDSWSDNGRSKKKPPLLRLEEVLRELPDEKDQNQAILLVAQHIRKSQQLADPLILVK